MQQRLRSAQFGHFVRPSRQFIAQFVEPLQQAVDPAQHSHQIVVGIDPDDVAAPAQSEVATFRRRRTALPEGIPAALGDGFASDAAKQAQWRAFLRKNRIDAPALEEVVADIRARLAAPLAQARERKAGA